MQYDSRDRIETIFATVFFVAVPLIGLVSMLLF